MRKTNKLFPLRLHIYTHREKKLTKFKYNFLFMFGVFFLWLLCFTIFQELLFFTFRFEVVHRIVTIEKEKEYSFMEDDL